ncbi:MAG: tripartite tricarboxylate transporter substrate binding protein, partial [Proteobacteria bacterium]|nr:tripartite tricarboxylate transporter substrate binding protein [Pseudomonadota bacterium]
MNARTRIPLHPTRRRLLLAMLAGACAAAPFAHAQAPRMADPGLPQGQLRIVVPYTPGGGTDILARAIAQQFSELYNRTVIVDNRPGANGTVGAAYVAKQQPDGLTMLIVPAGYAANPALYKSLPYNQDKDLAPVSELATGPLVLVVHPSLLVHSVKELIALAKSKPGELNVGNAGIGSLPHLSGELFNSLAGVKITAVPYKGAGAAQVDVLSGRVPIYFMNILQALPLIKEGRLRALG